MTLDKMIKAMPLSEQDAWFLNLYKPYRCIGVPDYGMVDRYAERCGVYIPTLHNKFYRYYLEVVLSHDIDSRVKDAFLTHRGYRIFRIKYGDEAEAKIAIYEMLRIRKCIPAKRKKKAKKKKRKIKKLIRLYSNKYIR